MLLLTLPDAQLAHGELPVLDRAAFCMEDGERLFPPRRELEALPGEIEAGGVGVFRRSSTPRLMR
jgi:hypothetical protein